MRRFLHPSTEARNRTFELRPATTLSSNANAVETMHWRRSCAHSRTKLSTISSGSLRGEYTSAASAEWRVELLKNMLRPRIIRRLAYNNWLKQPVRRVTALAAGLTRV